MTLLTTILLFQLLVVGKDCVVMRHFPDDSESLASSNSSSSVNSGATICADGWLPFEGSCYLFGNNAVHFTEAEHFCRQHHNSHLIHVNNARENEFIKDRLRDLKLRNWWIGITDEFIEGVWKWFDTDEEAEFSDWYPGQKKTAAEDCAIFWLSGDFKWGDYSCLGLEYPICETSFIGHSCSVWHTKRAHYIDISCLGNTDFVKRCSRHTNPLCYNVWVPTEDESCVGHLKPVCGIRGQTCGTSMTILG